MATVAGMIHMMHVTTLGKNLSGKRYMNIDIVLPYRKKIIGVIFLLCVAHATIVVK